MTVRPRVLFVSGREKDYIRNRVLINALQSRFDVEVLTPSLPSTIGRSLLGLASFLANRRGYDICFVGFYGQPMGIALSALQRKPIVLDAYVSTYDTLCEDRRWFPRRSPVGWLARWIDRRSCQVATHVLTDTRADARYFAETFGVPDRKLTVIYVGCDESIFYPRHGAPGHRECANVFYYGAFLPLHGTEVVIGAADLLRKRPDIHFVVGGDGPRYRAIHQMVDELELSNVDLVGWIPIAQLPDQIARASVCLGGHFSTIPKAARVISTKTFQFIAMRKPTIIGDSVATRELFVHGEHVYAVRMGDPAALADAISTLAGDTALCDRIASGGHSVFRQRLATDVCAEQLATVIEETMSVANGGD